MKKNILITFKEGQGLGNQLWLLSTALNISITLNSNLIIKGKKKFKGWGLMSKEFIRYYLTFKKNHAKIEWLSISAKAFYSERHKYPIYFQESSSLIDIINLFKNVEIVGNYQSVSLLPNVEILSSFFNLTGLSNSLLIGDNSNTCLINIRGGDYLGLFKSPCVKISYYINAIALMRQKFPNIRFKIVSDDYKYVKAIMPEFEILKGDLYDDFIQINNAKYIILSNSSFAFFPVYLSKEMRYAIAPDTWGGAQFTDNDSSWLSPTNYFSKFHFIDSNGKDSNCRNYFDAALSINNYCTPMNEKLIETIKYSFQEENSKSKEPILKRFLFRKIKRELILLIWYLRSKYRKVILSKLWKKVT